MKVLDIGCGIGGSAFYMARTYQVQNYYYLSLSQTHTHTYARARWLSNALMIKSHFTSLTSYLNDLGWSFGSGPIQQHARHRQRAQGQDGTRGSRASDLQKVRRNLGHVLGRELRCHVLSRRHYAHRWQDRALLKSLCKFNVMSTVKMHFCLI